MANIYWSTIQANFRLSNDADNLHFVLGRLLNTGRPRSALQICQDDFGRVDATIVAEILERVLHGEESEAPLPRSWYVGKALKHLRSSQIVNRQRLIRLEFGFFRALEYGAEYHADTLYEALMSDPALFVELLCILYKPHNGEKECPLTASEQTAAEIAWYVLRSCRRQPGTQPDGIIDPAAFVQFVDTARQLALKADRLEVCDSTLGQILAHAPTGADSIWPCQPAREILDRPELERMRSGFQTGAINKRGVTCRAPCEGGNQERHLADYYRSQGQALASSYVYLAAMLEKLARLYETDGQREDIRAKLQRETY